jgi:phage gp29-like protein
LPVIYLGDGCSMEGTNSTYEKAKTLVRDIRKDDQMGIVLPGPKMTADGKGILLELLSGGSLESADVGPVISRYEKRIALSMLAQWLMLGMDQVGSYALSQDQTDFFRQAVEAVLKMITSVLNRFAIPRLFKLNPSLMKKGDLPEIEYSLPVKPDFKMFAEAVNVMVGAGVLKAEDQTVKDAIRGLFGLPEEEELPEPEDMPVKPDPAAMMQAAAATAQQPPANQPPGQPPEVPPKPMPPEVIEQQGKLKAAAAQMQKDDTVEKADESAWSLATADIDVWAEADAIIEQAVKSAKPKRGRPKKNADSD